MAKKAEKEKKQNPEQEKLQAEFEELKNLLQRTQADFINFKRRTEENRVSFAKYATSDVIEQILPVMDNFALMAKHVPEKFEKDNWTVGVLAVEKQLEQVLASNGLERVSVLNKKFDHNLAEAVGTVEIKDQEDDIVVSEEAPGYLLNGKLIRPAKVIVNKLK